MFKYKLFTIQYNRGVKENNNLKLKFRVFWIFTQ